VTWSTIIEAVTLPLIGIKPFEAGWLIPEAFKGVLQDGSGGQLATGLVEEGEFLPQALTCVGDFQQGLLVVGHRSTQMGADPEGELPG
jgi:hypothetical protein